MICDHVVRNEACVACIRQWHLAAELARPNGQPSAGQALRHGAIDECMTRQSVNRVQTGIDCLAAPCPIAVAPEGQRHSFDQ